MGEPLLPSIMLVFSSSHGKHVNAFSFASIHATVWPDGLMCASYPIHSGLFLNRLDILPATAQPFLPQADLVVARADRKDIAAQGPADPPCYSVE